MVVALAALFWLPQAPGCRGPLPWPPIVDPDNPPAPQPPADIKGTYVVRVYGTETDQQPTWLVALLNDDAFWYDWFQAEGVSLHTFDPDNPQAASFLRAADSQGIKPPFLLHAQPGGIVRGVLPLREGTTAEVLGAWLKGTKR
jgi:hypothetical protein